MITKKLFTALLSLTTVAALFSGCGGKKSTPQTYGLAKNENKYLGNIISNEIPTDFTQYWNQITLENHSKWGHVEARRGTMVWDFVDEVYQYAISHNLSIVQHSLVWGGQQPNWINNLNEAEQRAEVEEFMQAYCERYPRTHLINVVNEPINFQASYKNALGGDGQTGWDWVIWSFEKARQHCPLQGLILSEYFILTDANLRSQYLEIANLLISRGLIDGIGVHASSLNRQNISAQEMQSVLNELAESGLPIYITQMYIQNTDLDLQRAKYEELFPVIWEHPAVKGVTLWGYENGKTFEQSDLLGENNAPNPALQWMQNYFDARRQ